MFDAYVIWYLFLAGAGAGSFVIASCKAFVDIVVRGGRLAGLPLDVRCGFAVSSPLLVLASLFLLLDLGSPERAWLVFLHPLDSTIGAGAFFVACLAFVSAAVIGLGLSRVPSRCILAGCWIMGFFVSLGVMSYTGILFSSMASVDVWHTALVPLLFVLSSISTGFAVMEVLAVLANGRATKRTSEKLSTACVLCEAVVLAAYLVDRWAYSDVSRLSCVSLTGGELAFPLWFGVVILGIVCPLAARVLSIWMPSAGLSFASAWGVLVGGFCLRYCIVNAALLPTALIGNFL